MLPLRQYVLNLARHSWYHRGILVALVLLVSRCTCSFLLLLSLLVLLVVVVVAVLLLLVLPLLVVVVVLLSSLSSRKAIAII